MNSKKLEYFNDDDSVDEKINLSCLGKLFLLYDHVHDLLGS